VAIELNYYELPITIIKAIRIADVLTGEFLRPVPAESLAELRHLGLALSDQPVLSRCGFAVRSWLMRGSPHAPQRIAALLRGVEPHGDNADPDEFADTPRLTGAEMAFSRSANVTAGRRV
jgi:hypothetical protein